jgi:hypothetical protein
MGEQTFEAHPQKCSRLGAHCELASGERRGRVGEHTSGTWSGGWAGSQPPGRGGGGGGGGGGGARCGPASRERRGSAGENTFESPSREIRQMSRRLERRSLRASFGREEGEGG